MASRTRDLMEHGNPLGRSANWIVVAIEAVALIVLGIWVLADKAGASTAILQITALVLLVASIMGIVAEFRSGASDLVLYTAFRAGIGAAIGAIGTARWFWDYINNSALRLILGWGLLAQEIGVPATLMAGAILTETIFSWPGIGKWMIDAIGKRDYVVVQSGLLIIALIVMAVNLIVDVLYAVINPRIRVQ